MGVNNKRILKSNLIIILLLSLVVVFVLCGCGDNKEKEAKENTKMSYKSITQDKAKELMKSESNYIILDVRTTSEYATGHIKGAICIPNETIGQEDIKELPDKNQLILVYCRSGNRSKQASQKLADMGYTNINEFGGIIEWDGETVTKGE